MKWSEIRGLKEKEGGREEKRKRRDGKMGREGEG